jgi:hypothetical protein
MYMRRHRIVQVIDQIVRLLPISLAIPPQRLLLDGQSCCRSIFIQRILKNIISHVLKIKNTGSISYTAVAKHVTRP